MEIEYLPFLIFIAFFCELIDSTIGMGYGTTLTPILLALGYQPKEIIPAVLFSEFLTGILAGGFHHGFGNVNFRVGKQDFKVMCVLTSLSMLGVAAAVKIAIALPDWLIKFYVGGMVLVVGLTILRSRNRKLPFSWRRIAGLGFIAAFNKGISGGGYGPVVTGGQVLSGVRGRNAVGIASLAEGITSLAGVTLYWMSGVSNSWHLVPSLSLGAIFSAPIAAFIVSRIPAGKLTTLIGGISTLLGSYTLIKLFA